MKLRRLSLVFGLVFAMVMALAQVANAAPNTAYEISFDGYCDGVYLVYPSGGIGNSATVDGHHTGCIGGGLMGTASETPEAAHITTNYGGCCLYQFLINEDRTWVIYAESGGQIFVINTGTWSPGPATGDGPPAGAVRGNAAASASTTAPSASYDISFDGYCDGLHINWPSLGLGTSDTVDGNHTGCIGGPLFGTQSTAGPNGLHITTNYGGCCLYHFLIKPDHHWVIYALNGDSIFVINSGTWSFGTPDGGGPAAGG